MKWLGTGLVVACGAGAATVPNPVTTANVSVLTAPAVVQILDQTVDWYRTLGVQQQNALEPSDQLILFANRQTAEQVVDLAFQIARANAELLSSEADAARAAAPQALAQQRGDLDAQHRSLALEIDASRDHRREAAKLSGLQGELAMVDARRNLLDAMVEFVDASDPVRARADALKTHIDAIAATVPHGAAPAAAAPAANPPPAAAAPVRFGIWDLAASVIKMRGKLRTIETVDARTAALAATFKRESSEPLARLQALSAESDGLAQRATTVGEAGAAGLRRDFDTLAWLFKQTSSILLPLTKEQVLLGQYRHNLSDWRSTAERQYRDALAALAARFGMLLGLLAGIFLLGELWRRAVLRFVQEPRRRAQWLLFRRIATWLAAVLIVALSITTEISTFATFAGLLTAGLAVALQSVLVSVVGYFFLIGKYGIRVGDRIQIGTVVGEVVELGLVRMHLLELNAAGPLGPTGRVVAFANLIVFQASGGLFKQIPGVDLSWHETTLRLPDGADYAALKDRLSAAVTAVTAVYDADVVRQARRIATETVTGAANDVTPKVQMRLADGHMEAVIGYPVHAPHTADIDERVAAALLGVLAAAA